MRERIAPSAVVCSLILVCSGTWSPLLVLEPLTRWWTASTPALGHRNIAHTVR